MIVNSTEGYWQKRKTKEKYLVTDQPGNFLLFLGVFISVVLGYSLRTFNTSRYLNDLVKQASQNIGSDWKVQFSGVRIYLREGFLPKIGLEVSDIQFSSESSCFLKPSGSVKNLRVPISILNLAFKKDYFSEVLLYDAKIEFKTSKYECDKNQKPKKVELVEPTKNKVSLIDKSKSVATQAEQKLKNIRVDRLELKFPEDHSKSLSLSNLVLENKSENPKIVSLKTKIDVSSWLNFSKEDLKVDVSGEYSEFPERILKLSILAGLREGHLTLSLMDRFDDNHFQLQVEAKNIPVQKILEIPQLKAEKNNYLKTGWLSFTGYSEGKNQNWFDSRMELKRLKYDGNFGEITSDEVILSNGFRKAFFESDFKLKFHKFSLDKFVEANRVTKVPEQINSLGELNGEVTFNSKKNAIAQGDLKNFSFYISSNGIRQIEKFDSLDFEAKYENQELQLLSKTILKQKKAIGELSFKVDYKNNLDLKAEFKDVPLTEESSRLLNLSDGGMLLSSLKLQAKGNIENLHIESRVKIPQIKHASMNLDKVDVEIQSVLNKSIQIALNVGVLQVNKPLQELMQKHDVTLLPEYQQIKFNYNSDYKTSKWRINTKNRWQAQGEWLANGEVVGELTEASKVQWLIKGTRDEPVFTRKN
ncbi:MAG: AsmA family protein [Bdellovibrionaceae bacterium]|nr:AsmA family protein [Pseudobdellovibrionaceae bacterium]